MANKRYYWLKLKEDFFENDDIKLIENLPNGKDYIIFYLKLLCKSLKNEGVLRYKNIIPYTPEMLSSITGTNIDIVNGALEKFKALNMIEFLDDGALFMSEVQNMIGSETNWAKVKREQRKKVDNVQNLSDNCPKSIGHCPTEKEIDIDKDIDIEKEKEFSDKPKKTTTKFVKPSIEEIKAYCHERGNNIDSEYFFDYYESKDWKVGNNNMKDWKASIRNWERNDKNNGKASESDKPVITKYNASIYEGII